MCASVKQSLCVNDTTSWVKVKVVPGFPGGSRADPTGIAVKGSVWICCVVCEEIEMSRDLFLVCLSCVSGVTFMTWNNIWSNIPESTEYLTMLLVGCIYQHI